MAVVSFLTLIVFGTFLLLLSILVPVRRNVLLYWTAAFIVYTALPLILLIDRNPDRLTLLMIILTDIIAYSLLFTGWLRFFHNRIRKGHFILLISGLLFAVSVYLMGIYGRLILTESSGSVMMFIILFYVIRQFRRNHSYSSGIIIILLFLTFAFTLIPLLLSIFSRQQLGITLSIYSTWLSYITNMLSLLIALMHSFRTDIEKALADKQVLLEELERQAVTDPLTGVLNRRGFENFIEYEFLQNKRRNTGYTITLCDIDHFKQVNDRWGHDCGDAVIKSVAETINSSIREQDCFARWGGEEFVILMLGNTLDETAVVVERIRNEIENTVVEWNGESIEVTMSFGISESRDVDEDHDQPIIRADLKLYEAKKSGRNRIES